MPALGAEIYTRYTGHTNMEEMIQAQAPKRIALHFVQQRIATWDHRKLAGTYCRDPSNEPGLGV